MNLILICCDALRADVGKAAGMQFDVCPTIDRLGAAGTRFSHAYCTTPLCVPSRISMLTGRWPDAHRVRMNLDAKDAIFTRDIYQVARDAGYVTGLTGKNHTYLTAGDVDTHIPMVWSGADLPALPANTRDFVSMADVMPTFCDAMQQPIPLGVQGNSLWRLLHGETQPGSDFEGAYVSVGLGGLFYDAADNVPLAIAEGPHNHRLWDSLNKVTQSGCEKMARNGDWKLIYDMMGYGQLYHLPTDPGEINNLFGQQRTRTVQADLMEELTRWLLRSESAVITSSLNHKV